MSDSGRPVTGGADQRRVRRSRTDPDPLTDAANQRSPGAGRCRTGRPAVRLVDRRTDRRSRNQSERRSFRFGPGDFVIRVHLTQATLIVMVEPPLSVGCRVVTEDRTDELRTDEYGEFAVAAPELPRGSRSTCRVAPLTPWITG